MVGNTILFFFFGNTILEHVLLLPGKHSQDWRIYLTSPFPPRLGCAYACRGGVKTLQMGGRTPSTYLLTRCLLEPMPR